MNENEPQQPNEVQTISSVSDSKAELEALTRIVSAIQGLPDRETQMRVVKSALTLLGWADLLPKRANGEGSAQSERAQSSFSEDRNLSPKAFLLEKKPITDIERVACLAYYYTHYRNTPHFKTLDISKLNTEAAQIKFSNAAGAVENATTNGFLVAAGKGNKQISAMGEVYVQALPDRESAKVEIGHFKPRRKSKRSGNGNDETEGK